MRPRTQKLAFRPSKMRFVLWGVGAVIIAFLAFMKDPGTLGERLNDAKQAAADHKRGDIGQKNTPPAFRMGIMGRVSHTPALLALEKGYLIATAQGARNDPEAWAEVRLFQEAREIERRLESGELDAATLPLRSVIALASRLGDRAPRVVSGSALGGDDRLVTRNPNITSLDGLRIGVTEAPTLDLQAAIKGATVTLSPASGMQQRILAGKVDAALASEPNASAVAATSGARVVDLKGVGASSIEAGSVLVVTRGFLEREPAMVEALVGWHELAAFEAQQDLAYAAERIRGAMQSFRVQPAPLAIWQKAMTSVKIDTDIPRDPLAKIAALAEPPVSDLASLLVETYLDEARKIKEAAATK